MTKRIIRDIPLNRVEGDLEIRVELENNRIVDAWSSGTMFRGFENLLVGRGARDGLVMTPRVCGICSTTHLMAAARALDQIAGVSLPDNAIRLRNVALMAEHSQSDVRQSVLMFLPDFTADCYAAHSLYAEAVKRYAPLAGERCVDVVRQTKTLLEIIAILGGQWPHSSFMVPGGVTYIPPVAELNQCLHILKRYRSWYEQRVLGCSLQRWQDVQSAADLDAWLNEAEAREERRAPHEHHLERRKGEGDVRLLRHLRHRPRALPHGNLREGVAAQQDGAFFRRAHAGHDGQKRRLARAVGPEDPRHLSRAHRERNAAQHGGVAVGEVDIVCFEQQCHVSVFRLVICMLPIPSHQGGGNVLLWPAASRRRSLSPHHEQKHRCPHHCGDDADGELRRIARVHEECARRRVRRDQKRRAREPRRGDQEPMVGAEDHAHEVRDEEPHEADEA